MILKGPVNNQAEYSNETTEPTCGPFVDLLKLIFAGALGRGPAQKRKKEGTLNPKCSTCEKKKRKQKTNKQTKNLHTHILSTGYVGLI